MKQRKKPLVYGITNLEAVVWQTKRNKMKGLKWIEKHNFPLIRTSDTSNAKKRQTVTQLDYFCVGSLLPWSNEDIYNFTLETIQKFTLQLNEGNIPSQQYKERNNEKRSNVCRYTIKGQSGITKEKRNQKVTA